MKLADIHVLALISCAPIDFQWQENGLRPGRVTEAERDLAVLHFGRLERMGEVTMKDQALAAKMRGILARVHGIDGGGDAFLMDLRWA